MLLPNTPAQTIQLTPGTFSVPQTDVELNFIADPLPCVPVIFPLPTPAPEEHGHLFLLVRPQCNPTTLTPRILTAPPVRSHYHGWPRWLGGLVVAPCPSEPDSMVTPKPPPGTQAGEDPTQTLLLPGNDPHCPFVDGVLPV